LLNRASAHRSTSGAPLVKPCYSPCCLSCVRILEHLLQRLQDLLRLPRRPSGRQTSNCSAILKDCWNRVASRAVLLCIRNEGRRLPEPLSSIVDRLLIKLQKPLKTAARLKISP